MERTRVQRTGKLLLLLLVLAWFLPQAAAYVVLRQEWFLGQVRQTLSQGLAAPYGLACRFESLKAGPGLGIELTGLTITDLRHPAQPKVVRLSRAYIHLSAFRFLLHTRHPEAALTEILVEDPEITLARDEEGAWVWERFMTGPPKQPVYLRPIVRLHQARLTWADSPFPHPIGRLTIPEATLDLRAYPRLRASTVAKTDLDPALTLRARAEYDLDDTKGWVQLFWRDASPQRWQAAGWLPADQIRFLRGRLQGEARLLLGPTPGLERASASFSGGLLRVLRTGWPIVAVDGRLSLRNSVLRLDSLNARFGRSTLGGNARLTLGRSDPSIDADLKVAELDLAAVSRLLPLPARTTVDGHLKGRIKVSGRLSDPEFSGDVSLTGGGLTYPTMPPIENLRLQGRLAGKSLLIQSFQARMVGAGVSGRGRLRLLPAPQLEMDLATKGFPLEGLLAEFGQAGWGGRADLSAHLAAGPDRWGAQASVAWREATWRQQVFPDGSARITCTSSPGLLHVEMGGTIGAGRFQADGQRKDGLWQGSAYLDRVAVAPIAPFLPPGYRDLAGEATANLAWRGAPGEPSVRFAGRVTHPRLAGRTLDEFRGSLLWHGTQVDVEAGQIKLGEASASLQGRLDWRRRDLDLNVALHRLPLALLHPQAFGRAEGQLKLAGRWPDALDGQGWAHLSDLSWQGVELGAAEVQLELAGDWLSIRRGHLASPAGEMELAGGLSLAGEGRLGLEVTRLTWDVGALGRFLPGRAGLQGKLNGNGRVIGTIRSPEARAHLELGPGQAYDFEWQSASTDLRWRDGLTVEDGLIRAAGAEVAVSGGVGPAGWDLGVRSKNADLTAILAALPYQIPWSIGRFSGRASVDARITGPLAHPTLTGDVEARQLILGELACERLQGQFRLDGSVVSFPNLQAWAGERSYAAQGWLDLKAQTVDLVMNVTRGDLAALLDLANVRPPWPVKGQVTGGVELTGHLKQPALTANLRLEEGSAGTVSFAGEIECHYDGQTLICQRASLTYDGGELTASGRLADDEFQLALNARALPLDDLATLAGYHEKIRGRGNLNLTLNRAGRSMHGEYRLEIGAGASVAGIPLDRVMVEGAIKDRNIVLSQGELVSGEHSLSASGRFPLPQNLGVLEVLLRGVPGGQDRLGLRVEGAGFPAALLNPALQGKFAFSGGSIDIDATLAGTWAAPAMEGSIDLVDASGGTSLLPEQITGLNARFELTGQDLILRQAAARIGAGRAEFSGTIGLARGGPRYDLRLKGSNIAYKNPAFIDGVASNLDLALKGGPIPQISGAITVREARVTVGSAPPAPSPPPIGLDIHLVAKRDVKFFLPGVADIPVAGELQLRGTLRAPTLTGVVNGSKGVIYVYGERFDVTLGVGTFTPDRGYLPYLELQGNKMIRDTRVFVRVRGEIAESGLAINFWSDPPLSEQQILSLLRWTAPIGSDPGGGRLLVGGFDLVIDTVFGQVSEDFRRWINADQFEFSLDDRSGTFTLQMGKYVNADLFVSYQILFDEFSTRIWSFDYQLNSFLVLNGVFSTTADPTWSLAYQWKF